MKKYLLILALLTLSVSAKAGLLIEPQAYYAVSSDLDLDSTLGNITDASGIYGLGLRAGYRILGWDFALEYTKGLAGTVESSTTPLDSDYTDEGLGIMVGFNFPVLLRVYGGYKFKHDVELDTAGTVTTLEGDGLYLGVGYTGFPIISINLEYHMYDYSDASQTGGGTASLSNTSANHIVLGVSAPLALPF